MKETGNFLKPMGTKEVHSQKHSHIPLGQNVDMCDEAISSDVYRLLPQSSNGHTSSFKINQWLVYEYLTLYLQVIVCKSMNTFAYCSDVLYITV